MKSVVKNYLFNTGFQVLNLLIPLITMPYITRIFTPEQIGINSFTMSIVTYFVLLAGLGVQIYGNRAIAYARDDKTKVISEFWSIFFAIAFTSLTAFIVYLIFVVTINAPYKKVQLIQSVYILVVGFNISWLFMGMEDFKKMTIRDSIIKIVGTIFIFTFIKNSEDFILYIFIFAVMSLFSVLSIWLYLPQYIKGFEFNINKIRSHYKPLLLVYLPQLAIQIYAVLDKTLLGVISTADQVAFYDMSQKIVKMLLMIVTSLGTVMMPRISYLISSNRIDEVKKNIKKAFCFMSYLAFPMAFGIAAIAANFSIWFFGNEYQAVGPLMALSSFIIIAISWSNIIGMQLLLPLKREREYTISVLIGSGLNLIFNIVLIPRLGAFGAVIATLIAEFGVTIAQIILVNRFIDVKIFILNTKFSFISSVIMFISIIFISSFMSPGILMSLTQVIFGIFMYVSMMFLFKSPEQNEIFCTFISLINKRR